MDYTCFRKMAKLAIYRLIVMMIGSLLTINADAQIQLRIEPVANEVQSQVNGVPFKNSFKSRQELFGYLQQLPVILQSKGYLSASIDSIAEKDSLIIAFLHLGKQYQWNEVRINPEDQQLLNDLGFNTSIFKIADATTISSLPTRVIDHYQNNGHPFAKVKWDSVQLIDNQINAKLFIDKGHLYKMDSISLHGSAKLSKHFLERYLGLPEDGIYKRDVLDDIDQKLAELQYIQQSKPWNVTMQPTGYVLNFYFEPKRSNQVDALIGFLPSNQQNGGKLLLTVDANLLFRNAFGTGETIDFSWEQIQPRSPRLHLIYQQPYIFKSRFGLDLAFQLYKKDSSFLNVFGNIGLQYSLGSYQSAKVILQTQRTNLLDVDTNSIRFSKRLPDIIDLNNVNIGIEYAYNKTNYRFNPRNGIEFSLSAIAGKKTIRRNNAITSIKDGSINYNTLYDSLELDSYQLRFRVNAAKYFPIAKQAVLKTALQAGLLHTPNYFRNEMFQVGGYRLLRGFDEESIFANRFAVATIEYRYLVGLNSYFFGFTDLGYTNSKNEQTAVSHTYFGIGGGMAFETKQGIFNISYAVGKRNDLRFDLRQSKIHFGYTSFF